MAEPAVWTRAKPALELAGDGRWDARLLATLGLDFDVLTNGSPRDGAEAILLFTTVAACRDDVAEVRGRSAAVLVAVLENADVLQRVEALEDGADDVLSEPYETCELLARLRAVMRRVHRPLPNLLRVADLELDLARGGVRRGTRAIDLSRTEFALLTALARRAGDVVPHRRLAEEVWGTPDAVGPTTLHTFVSYLRGKIEEPSRARLLRTVRGVGYALGT
ncbi:MAG: response regulator transcription factor [Candidatus Eremiobacteraeota bacterium]|nr:response regulator transcription factor [Candidatus Eremiobacteraeota bacterium]MBV9409873.1 response regulator transcription factor [Candidatus Eremiobacteraeota bacterium]